jgi:ERCC4-type nuclease
MLSPSSNSGVCDSCDKTSLDGATDGDGEEADASTHEVSFEQLDAIGESGASNLREAGFVTVSDVTDASDDELLDVSWIGEKGVQSIRQKIETFK